jgi:hypothetical protein
MTMKRSVLLLALLLFVGTTMAQAQGSPILVSSFCHRNDSQNGADYSCFSAVTAYVGYVSMETVGLCTNGSSPITSQNIFWACSPAYRPTAQAVGWSFGGIPNVWGVPGKVYASASLTNYPGNPSASTSMDCYMVPNSTAEPVLPC